MTLQRAAVVVPHLKNGKMRVIAGRQIMDKWKRNQEVGRPSQSLPPTQVSLLIAKPMACMLPRLQTHQELSPHLNFLEVMNLLQLYYRIKYQIKCSLWSIHIVLQEKKWVQKMFSILSEIMCREYTDGTLVLLPPFIFFHRGLCFIMQ